LLEARAARCEKPGPQSLSATTPPTSTQTVSRSCRSQSKTDKLYHCEAMVTVNGKESKAMADQIMTVSKERLTERMGFLSLDQMRFIDLAIRIQLGLAA
jgi:mRNA-degrading endonuclease toxin of MazEF toxin-antitoxin module